MNVITTALLAALADLSGPAVKDGYQFLKNLLVKKWGSGSAVDKAVSALEEKPDSPGRQSVVTEELKAAGAEDDKEILDAAQKLIEIAKSSAAGNNIVQTISGSGNFVVGSGNMTINRP